MNNPFLNPPVLGIAAWSGTGKTALLVKLLPLLRAQGLRVGMLKHAHHAFDIDHPGKDSYELRKAGAEQMLIASNQRWALMVESPQSGDVSLTAMLDQLNRNALDLILVEGFRHDPFPKIELHRAALGKPLLFPEDASIIAIACDTPLETDLPLLDLNAHGTIAAFILSYCAQHHTPD
jgi:molybdopterin-guanine dinucleotide biosynthesis protein MobB